PEVRLLVPGRQLHGPLAELTAAIVRGELLFCGARAHVPEEEVDVRQRREGVDAPLARERRLQQIPRAVEARHVLIVADDEGTRTLGRRVGDDGRGEGDEREGEHDRTSDHQRHCSTRYVVWRNVTSA